LALSWLVGVAAVMASGIGVVMVAAAGLVIGGGSPCG